MEDSAEMQKEIQKEGARAIGREIMTVLGAKIYPNEKEKMEKRDQRLAELAERVQDIGKEAVLSALQRDLSDMLSENSEILNEVRNDLFKSMELPLKVQGPVGRQWGEQITDLLYEERSAVNRFFEETFDGRIGLVCQAIGFVRGVGLKSSN